MEDELRAARGEGEEETSIKLGKKQGDFVVPSSTQQFTSSLDVSALSSKDVDQLGVPQNQLVPCAIRFADGYKLSTEKIPLSTTDKALTFDAWSVSRIPKPTGNSNVASGRKKPTPFNFSGKLSIIGELHQALCRIQRQRLVIPPESVEDLIASGPETDGTYNLADGHQIVHKAKYVAEFGNGLFHAFVEHSTYKAEGGTISSYQVKIKNKYINSKIDK